VQREGESRYQRLVENINDAIIVDDARGASYLPTAASGNGSDWKEGISAKWPSKIA
jgi:hypothetical protein